MSLVQELAAQDALSRARLPDEVWAAIAAKTVERARARLAQSCLQQDQTPSAFCLPNAVAEKVSSDA